MNFNQQLLNQLIDLAFNFYCQFDELEKRKKQVKKLQQKLAEIENEMGDISIDKSSLKRLIIVLHDVVQNNPVEELTDEQAYKILVSIASAKIYNIDIKRDEYLRIIKEIRATGLFILPTHSKIIKDAKEVFGENKKEV